MPRQSRAHSISKVYHIMMRGNEKKNIFLDNEDRDKFLNILFDKKLTSEYKLYAYCFMSNHVHLLMKESKEEIALCMKRINISYALYFNKKYSRIGHLFQDRFKSECVDNIQYLLSVIRYIHNNPVKAGITDKPMDYPWSSYSAYIDAFNNDLLVDIDEILLLFSENAKDAVRSFLAFSKLGSDECFMDYTQADIRKEVTINNLYSAKSYVEDYLCSFGIRLEDIKDKSNVVHRNDIILHLKQNSNLSEREIGFILGLDRNMIRRAK